MISCPSPGNCAAAGSYETGSASQPFVVSQVDGTWGKTVAISMDINSISCASVGNCGAGGYYYDGPDHLQAFVVSEVSGTWGHAIEVPGSARLYPHGTIAAISTVSCSAPGNCSAGGSYTTDGSSGQEALVLDQVNGIWGSVSAIPGSPR